MRGVCVATAGEVLCGNVAERETGEMGSVSIVADDVEVMGGGKFVMSSRFVLWRCMVLVVMKAVLVLVLFFFSLPAMSKMCRSGERG
jgi:Na+-transporting NADH:ubiquinone oxidoreductase subunit NqrB